MNNPEILQVEALINRWKAMARVYYHDKDYNNATLCRQLRDQAKLELIRLRNENVYVLNDNGKTIDSFSPNSR